MIKETLSKTKSLIRKNEAFKYFVCQAKLIRKNKLCYSDFHPNKIWLLHYNLEK